MRSAYALGQGDVTKLDHPKLIQWVKFLEQYKSGLLLDRAPDSRR